MKYVLMVRCESGVTMFRDAGNIHEGQELYVMSLNGDLICNFTFMVDLTRFTVNKMLLNDAWFNHPLSDTLRTEHSRCVVTALIAYGVISPHGSYMSKKIPIHVPVKSIYGALYNMGLYLLVPAKYDAALALNAAMLNYPFCTTINDVVTHHYIMMMK